ncbi:MAG: nucleotide exchange factor GrpE [Gammaproteobacteria bacterium]
MSNTENEQPQSDENVEAGTAEQEQESDPIAQLEARLAAAEKEAADAKEQALRTIAEMENLRKRTSRDLENAHKYALEKFAQELLPVIDSLEMGVAAAQDEGVDVARLREGTEMTLRLFETAIDKFGIKGVHPHGEVFNPEHHQAMSMIDSPEHAPNTVIDVMQKGYLLNDRLVRPAMVVVASAKSGNGDRY